MKLSDQTPKEWYSRLKNRTAAQRVEALKWWQYMDLEQPLVYVARIIEEQGGRFPALLLPWAELVVETVIERLKLDSFLAGEEPVAELMRSWKVNKLAVHSPEAHTAASVAGLHFLMVGPGGPHGMPLVTTEYCDQVAVELDPRTQQPIAGLKTWRDDALLGGKDRAVLYLPTWPTIADGAFGPCRVFELDDKGEMVPLPDLGEWSEIIANDPMLPSVPLLPMLNKPRRGVGQSDLIQIKPALDGGNQIATNMLAGIEHHAVGRKWVVGATEKDFVDENDNPIPLWKVAMGDVWGIPHAKAQGKETPPEIKVGQFAASDLRNFHESQKVLAQVAASKYGLPPSYMGYASDNPPSADTIQYTLERLVLRAEQHQVWYGGPWDDAARIQWAILGKDLNDLVDMESVWRNAATPTLGSAMDAAVKGLQSGLIDQEQAWIDLRYSEAKKQGMRDRMAKADSQFRTTALNLRNVDVSGGTGVTPPAQPGATNAPAAIGA